MYYKLFLSPFSSISSLSNNFSRTTILWKIKSNQKYTNKTFKLICFYRYNNHLIAIRLMKSKELLIISLLLTFLLVRIETATCSSPYQSVPYGT
jgi:hypothetical protein